MISQCLFDAYGFDFIPLVLFATHDASHWCNIHKYDKDVE